MSIISVIRVGLPHGFRRRYNRWPAYVTGRQDNCQRGIAVHRSLRNGLDVGIVVAAVALVLRGLSERGLGFWFLLQPFVQFVVLFRLRLLALVSVLDVMKCL